MRLVTSTLFLFLVSLLVEVCSAAPDENAFLTNARQITYAGRRSGESYFSPDGKSLIFQSERDPSNPFYQIHILDLESGEIHQVSPGIGKTTCSFFRPNSDQVLFASTHLDPEALAKQKAEIEFRASGKERRYSWDYDEQFDIFTAVKDGTEIQRLTTAQGYDAEGAYSPDGEKIVFCSIREAYSAQDLSPDDRKRLQTDPSYFAEIYIMNADGSQQQRLTQSPGYDGGPFFSPDGHRIVWRRFDESGMVADIYTMGLDGSDVRRLTDFGAMSWAPYFHPSSQYIIFTSNKLGFANFELFLVDTAGTREPIRVTYSDGFDGLASFSPGGKRLCWTSNRPSDGKSQLFVADWNDSAARSALAASPPRAQSPGAPAQAKASNPASSSVVQPAKLPQTNLVQPSNLAPAISTDDLREQVSFLASDALEGRSTGSRGAEQAAEFIAQQFQQAGLEPSGDNGTYFQTFEFNAGVRVITNQTHLSISFEDKQARRQELAVEKDFRPFSFTANGEAEGEVVFAGYGLRIPGKPGEGYDSYAGLDLTNKIALVLRYVPESVEPKRRQELLRYASLRYKAMSAREHGAKAILVVGGPNSPNAGELVPLSFDSGLSGSEIIAASVSGTLAQQLLAPSGKTLKDLQSALDTENPHAEGGFLLPSVRVKLTTAVEFIKKKDRNVLGYLPPPEPRGGGERLVVGAHYDHLGLGEAGAMLIPGDEGKIHNGADDNASGVSAVLELAADLAQVRSERARAVRGVVFALWSGEELGLIGSTRFTEQPAFSNIVAYLNFDMVGRLRDNKLILQGMGSSSVWPGLIEKRNVSSGFNLVLQDDPYLPTDATAFYTHNVPVLSFFTGSHEEYHRPADKPETLNYDGLARVARFARGLVLDLMTREQQPDYVKVKQSNSGGSRDNLRVYLGTIPDYSSEVSGVKLSGVRGGSPAEKAGLKGGDIIVEFANQKVANIYDYTYALDAAKIGQSLQIVVERDGQRVSVTAVPEARK